MVTFYRKSAKHSDQMEQEANWFAAAFRNKLGRLREEGTIIGKNSMLVWTAFPSRTWREVMDDL